METIVAQIANVRSLINRFLLRLTSSSNPGGTSPLEAGVWSGAYGRPGTRQASKRHTALHSYQPTPALDLTVSSSARAPLRHFSQGAINVPENKLRRVVLLASLAAPQFYELCAKQLHLRVDMRRFYTPPSLIDSCAKLHGIIVLQIT